MTHSTGAIVHSGIIGIGESRWIRRSRRGLFNIDAQKVEISPPCARTITVCIRRGVACQPRLRAQYPGVWNLDIVAKLGDPTVAIPLMLIIHWNVAIVVSGPESRELASVIKPLGVGKVMTETRTGPIS